MAHGPSVVIYLTPSHTVDVGIYAIYPCISSFFIDSCFVWDYNMEGQKALCNQGLNESVLKEVYIIFL